MDDRHPPHPVPAAGLFGATWHLSRVRATPTTRDEFEARLVANDRSAEHAAEGADRLGLVA